MVRLNHIDHRFYSCFGYFSANHPNLQNFHEESVAEPDVKIPAVMGNSIFGR